MGLLNYQINVYVDGSCSGNPGPGGVGVLVIFEGRTLITKAIKSFEETTTNNRMEIFAIIQGILESVKIVEKLTWENQESFPKTIKIYSDSKYAVNCAIGKYKHKANHDLWEEFEKAMLTAKVLNYSISFEYVKAKSTRETLIVDTLAKSTW